MATTGWSEAEQYHMAPPESEEEEEEALERRRGGKLRSRLKKLYRSTLETPMSRLGGKKKRRDQGSILAPEQAIDYETAERVQFGLTECESLTRALQQSLEESKEGSSEDLELALALSLSEAEGQRGADKNKLQQEEPSAMTTNNAKAGGTTQQPFDLLTPPQLPAYAPAPAPEPHYMASQPPMQPPTQPLTQPPTQPHLMMMPPMQPMQPLLAQPQPPLVQPQPPLVQQQAPQLPRVQPQLEPQLLHSQGSAPDWFTAQVQVHNDPIPEHAPIEYAYPGYQ